MKESDWDESHFQLGNLNNKKKIVKKIAFSLSYYL